MKNNLGNKEIMSANIIYYMELYHESRKDLSKLFSVPYTTICDWINAKTYPRIDKIELMAKHWNIEGEFFALRVKGDSMEPRIKEGDIVIVRKQDDVDNGDLAVMLVNGDEATLKKIQKFNGGINLIPSNPSYAVMTYTSQEILDLPVRCLGKVVELRARF